MQRNQVLGLLAAIDETAGVDFEKFEHPALKLGFRDFGMLDDSEALHLLSLIHI